jgi:hypothetical protein
LLEFLKTWPLDISKHINARFTPFFASTFKEEVSLSTDLGDDDNGLAAELLLELLQEALLLDHLLEDAQLGRRHEDNQRALVVADVNLLQKYPRRKTKEIFVSLRFFHLSFSASAKHSHIVLKSVFTINHSSLLQ